MKSGYKLTGRRIFVLLICIAMIAVLFLPYIVAIINS